MNAKDTGGFCTYCSAILCSPPGTGPLGSLPLPISLAPIPLSSEEIVPPPVALASATPIPPLMPPPSLGFPNIPQEPLGTGNVSLSMSLWPVPARIVQAIRTSWYVEMCDLLADNVAVCQHDIHGAMGVQVLPDSSRPKIREVTSLPSWVCCFLIYIAVGTADPVARQRLTYAVLLIREALRHGVQGWLEYDCLFRQQAAIDPTLPWNLIHPGLQATTMLGQSARPGTFCLICAETDHSAPQCAMAQLQQPTLRSGNSTTPRAGTVRRICSSWNEGNCMYPGTCTYRHVCSRCFQPLHPARDCRTLSRPWAGSGTHRPPASPARSSSS